MLHYIQLSIDSDDFIQLEQLIGDRDVFVAGDVRELLEHLARLAADGVRWPGSWKRSWIIQATGQPL